MLRYIVGYVVLKPIVLGTVSKANEIIFMEDELLIV
jgi:hypothetical protein